VPSDLERAFGKAMLSIYHEAKKVGYTAGYFLRMLSELGPTETARRLIESETPSDGFTRLYELGRLDLTVEALALVPEWRDLFTNEQRRTARDRLLEYGWDGELPGSR
jgi:hypothetical protein